MKRMAKMEQTYKAKYLQLKSQYMNSVDTAFRLGFEQGKQQAELDNAAQQQMQAQEMATQAAGAPPPGAQGPEDSAAPDATASPPDAAENAPPGAAPAGPAPMQESEHPDGTELDQHIAKLEALLGKSEVNPEDLTKSVLELKAFRKSQVQAIELKKSARAIKEISKALHRPSFKLSVQAAHNMSDNQKRAVTLQHKIVDDVMKKWEEEEMKTAKSIHDIISVEGLTKKE